MRPAALKSLVVASAFAALCLAAAPALAGPRLEPVAGPNVTIEQRGKQPVAFSRLAGSAVALMVQQGAYATHDRPVLILSVANAGKTSLSFGPDALSVLSAGQAVPVMSAEAVRAEAEKDARDQAEMRMGAAYASAEGAYSSNGVGDERAGSAARGALVMGDAARSSGVLAGFKAADGDTTMGMRAVTIAPGEVATLYVPIRKLTRADADLQVRVSVGGETHVLPLHVNR